MTTYGAIAYTYTSNGDLLTATSGGETTTYAYDVFGNLTAVTVPSGTQIAYIIDGQHRRIGKKVNGVLTHAFLYGSQLRPAAELDGSRAAVSRFVYGTRINVPDYLVKGGTTYRLLTDHLGSVRLVVNTASGAIVQRIDYDEFGQITQDTTPGFQPFGFAGGLYDPDTKLTRFGARDYDAFTGRWTTKDPIQFEGGHPNLFVYVPNDPINLIDPKGTDWVDTTANISAGIGDALLLGHGDELRAWTDEAFGWIGSAMVNRCSNSYRGASITTSVGTLFLGGARLAYAGAAKAISHTARTAEQAVKARNALKIGFRMGLDRSSRIYSTEQMLEKYGAGGKVIEAAGRTDAAWNIAGGSAMAGAINPENS